MHDHMEHPVALMGLLVLMKMILQGMGGGRGALSDEYSPHG